VQGKPQYQSTYDGKTYYFPSDKERQMFLADPAKYVPALGGDCTVCLAKMGKRMPGSIHHAAIHRGRLYLFPSDEQKQMFLADPDAYADVDLALNGQCAVCLTRMNREVPGKPEFTAVHQGLRYLFPSAKERDMFLANPKQYTTQPTSTRRITNSSVRTRSVTVRGSSTCAACEHGVKPVGASDTLGLAINSADGGVFVVEDAHRLYPSIYKGRYDGLPLEVSGQVVKRSGKIAWIKPTYLKVLN